ncbi:MAG: hypothetical protein E7541_02890 [Ruminococcaceae bacterium]|nr:hypothetical protein [Oscillospiraceae bacterium]
MKRALIFGDSYSTFAGCIPEGYEPYYPGLDVETADKTWWHLVAAEAPLTLVRNDSWSGSTICYTGYNGVDRSRSSSFIYRLRCLVEEGFFEKNAIDTVLVFGGTNDSWTGGPLGEPLLEGAEEKDLYAVLPAIGHFFAALRQAAPRAAVYCLINTDLKPEITTTLEVAARHNGAIPVVFSHIDKQNGHPTAAGMRQIADRVLQVMDQQTE